MAKTKKDFTSMMDVSLMELEQIFFMIISSHPKSGQKTLDVICSHFTVSCNKQSFDVSVHL